MRYTDVYIAAFGYQLPPNVLSSEDIETRLGPLYAALHLQKGQLEALTGIQERRCWDPGTAMSTGAVAAGRQALEAAGISVADIGMLVYGGVCRENLEPATACAVAEGLGLAPASQVYDLSNACLGVLNGMVQIANAIELGQVQAGMVVSCESSREIIDLTIERMLAAGDMQTFKQTVATLTGGSGAVAVILTAGSLSHRGHRFLGGVARSAAQHHRLCTWGPDTGIPAAGLNVMNTDSVAVLQHGTTLGVATFAAFQRHFALPPDKPDKVVCHQVGAAHQRAILNAIGIPAAKDFTTFRYLGNMGTVSLPLTAAIAAEREYLVPGDWVAFLGIGSGLNCLMLGIEW